jgi:hypothetical protein
MTQLEIQSAISFVTQHQDLDGSPLRTEIVGNSIVLSISWTRGDESGVDAVACSSLADVREALGY